MMAPRLISAFTLALGVLILIWFTPPGVFLLLLLAVSGLSIYELARMFLHDRVELGATVFAGLIALVTCTGEGRGALLVLSLVFFGLCLVFMWREDMGSVALKVGMSCFALLSCGICLSFWQRLREIGKEWVLLILLPACLTDTFGLLVGKTLGKRKMAPIVSPNKTWEGFFGALAGSLLGTFLIWVIFFQQAFSIAHVVILSLLIWLASPLGDLVESMIKRSAGVKDSSHLIPGHGGMLDRVDALLFSAPVAYAYLTWVMK